MLFSISTLCTIAVGAQAVFGTPIKSRTAYNVKERHSPPQSWKKVARAPAGHKIHMKLGLKQGNFEELDRHLWEVSDPDHDRYGQHLSLSTVNELVAPKEETLDLVHEWLLTNGVKELSYSESKDWINIYIDVATAEALLDTKYSVYQHVDGSMLVRTSEWSLPAHLHDHIDTIQPTTSFMRNKANSKTSVQYAKPYYPANYQPPTNETIAKVCKFFPVTIECFRTLYGTINYKQKVPGINKIAFNNYLNQTPIRPDIEKFLSEWRPEATKAAFTFKSIEINGGKPAQTKPLTPEQVAAGDDWAEANLDAQTIIGMTYENEKSTVYSYSTGGEPPFIPDASTPTDTNEPYLEWINYVSGQKDVPAVVSSSYGDSEQTVPESYAKRVCSEFAKLGARGISLLVSSGDDGVGSDDKSECITNDGKNTTTFLPAFPAGCPYVTTVGATQQFEPEVSAYRAPGIGPDGRHHGFYSSGSGFSYYFKRPRYQDAVVPAYIKSLNGLYDGLYNKDGRGYPDLAAQGLYFAYVGNLTDGSISGTSASCPLVSSIISLANDALISRGKAPLGFLNPWLYKVGYKGFTDILSGTAHGCGGDGFPVTKGWDPVTGFGTPQFPKILELLECRD